MRLVLFTLALFTFAAPPLLAQDSEQTVSDSDLWYAEPLRERFSDGVPIHGATYPLDELPVAPRDITSFEVSARTVQRHGVRALSVTGSAEIGAVPSPLEVMDGARGKRYMLHLQAYLFSPQGRLVWQQQGFPIGGAWVASTGGRVQFELTDTYEGAIDGYRLMIVAAGDPILSSSFETRVLLGAFEQELD